ncbi:MULTISPECIES: GntR family transcriptional regulator [Streptomyces]|uniref:GntR family transcriptional regulator n=1 Tax=Streptomyces TaxID=1883 RepID=UPI001E556B39|nr:MULTISPECIES: GntR family transcriptional regulator [Streptomyces]
MDEESRREGASLEVDRVMRILLDQIAGGIFPPGSRLPPQRETAKEFGVARDTVQRALRKLADEGYIQSRQGSGTRVLRPPRGEERWTRPGLLRGSLGQLVQDAFRVAEGGVPPASIRVRVLCMGGDGGSPDIEELRHLLEDTARRDHSEVEFELRTSTSQPPRRCI